MTREKAEKASQILYCIAKTESDIDSLFGSGGTSALVSNISGLEDFELICFLVVKDGDK